jgi:N-acetylglucosamine-6-sulfatase
MLNMGYQAVRTDRWKLIHYVDLEGMDELYDLHADPFEVSNIIAAPEAQAPLKDLKAELQRLLKASQ